ncbi:hypothetical protein [Amycolatopsis australiensis]|uniref:Uncharacterized protein n=1 Tax=Amycolatopsis australiensis TaxID=546364 RepID=A0A1K1R0X4_9PSEU|nr:hypothetical protein [Amycolatopsis australiensis]SFW65588.1 hypothetical protein SAMN04489730_2507 [Amycolatopsis australiensis]
MRRIDVTDLPGDVVAQIDALGPGEHLVITRDGEPVAVIRGVATAPKPSYGHDVTVVATAMKLSASARSSLAAELGGDYVVLDLHAAPATADVLLVPPSSPQLVGHLRAMFPKARVVVTEIEDDELGVSYRGPVHRMLDAGAETYLASTTIPRLAEQLDAVAQRRQIGAARLEIEAGPS